VQAKDVMTIDVVTVSPDTEVSDIAKLLLERHISALPVVDGDGGVVGIVSEGDLLHRRETDTEKHRNWWLGFLVGNEQRAAEYSKSHGTKASEIMSREVVTVNEDAQLGDIAELLEIRRIKRVPVLRDGKLVGIVSRANLLHGLAARREEVGPAPSSDDRTIRETIIETVRQEGWVTHGTLNVLVDNGVVELWGWVDSPEERQALKVAAENVTGVKEVRDRLGSVPPWVMGA
jgi:CBS domain-containing protein